MSRCSHLDRKNLVRILALAGLALAALAWAPAPVAGQTNGVTKVSATHPGARFRVDGFEHQGAASFQWPTGSKHILEFPVIEDGYQYNSFFQTRFTFGGWSDNLGLLAASGGLVLTVTADPSITSYTVNVGVEHLLRVVWYEGIGVPPMPGPSQCGAGPGDPVPLEFRVGVVYIDGVCYWNNVEMWMGEGTHTLNAFPYPGFVFIGWNADKNPPHAYLRTFEITGPLTLIPRFEPAKRVNFRTDPPGLIVKVDGAQIRTTEVEPCEPNNLLPPGAPLTIRQACTGEFDFALNSRHVIGAVSPQMDRNGRGWVFVGYSNGMGQDAEYRTGPTVYPEETLVARFERGVNASFTTAPPGLRLEVDGQASASNYHVFAPGSTHRVSAPLSQVDERGRRYAFQRWSNAGPASQELVVPREAVDGGLHLTANYELLGRLVISSNPARGTVLVDGEPCPAPCTVDRPLASEVTLEVPAISPVSDTYRLEFVSWSDGGPRQRVYRFASTEPAELVAQFRAAYRLSIALDPPEGGRVTAEPASADGFYAPGTAVALTAEAADGYRFRRWDLAAQGRDLVAVVTVSEPLGVIARFDKTTAEVRLTIRSAAPGAPDGVVAPGSLISIFGPDLAPAYVAGPTAPFLAQTLAGVSVVVGDRILPLVFVSPEQINAQLPRDLGPGEYELRVIRVGYADKRGTFRVEAVAPGLFSGLYDGESVAMSEDAGGAAINPEYRARRGELITVFGTGFGPYKLDTREGVALPPAPAYTLEMPVELWVGGEKAEVEWAGGAAGYAGMDAVRFRIPAGLPPGATLEIKVRVGERESNVVRIPLE